MIDLRSRLVALNRRPLLGLLLIGTLVGGMFLTWWGINAWRYDQAHRMVLEALGQYHFEEAIKYARQCIELRPRDPVARLLLVQATRRAGMFDEAETIYNDYLDLVESPSENAVLQRAMLFAQRGQLDVAQDYLRSCLEVRHPDTEQILEALATGYAQLYHFQEARSYLARLMQLAPDNVPGMLLQALVAEASGNVEKAIQGLKHVLELDPDQPQARFHLATLLFRKQNTVSALEQYEELLVLRPKDPRALLGVMRCHQRLGQVKEFRADLERLAKDFPDQPDALLERGLLASQDRNLEEAEKLLRRAHELSPFDYEISYHLGLCLEKRGKSAEAKVHLDRFRKAEADLARLEKLLDQMVQQPGNADLLFAAGQLCLSNGQDSEGLRWLAGALQINPRHQAAHEALADYFASKGNKARATYHRGQASSQGGRGNS